MVISTFIKIIIIALFIGLTSGLLSSIFLHLLTMVTDTRLTYPTLIWGLPLFGFVFSLIIKKLPHHINRGVPHIVDELDNDKSYISPWMAPFILLSSIATHLFGGSAGREGVGVIMGVSAAHLLEKFNFPFYHLRRFLIHAGIAAGFSSIFGTPFAAIAFAFELSSFKRMKELNLLICTTIASMSALLVPYLMGPVHQQFKVSLNFNEVIPYLLIVGIVSGLGANLFYWACQGYTKFVSKIFPHLISRLTVGGLLITLIVFFTNSYQYIGIGTDVIAESFFRQMSVWDFFMKALLTIMTISVGFKGGEVTPLFFMGSTLSNWSCSILNFKNFGLSSALGMVALFGAATRTPIASAIMGAELFGWKMGIPCFFSCLLANLLMGKRSVYKP